MDIRGVDPRDQEWEIPDPKYRVYFFDATGLRTNTGLKAPTVPKC